MFRFLHPPDEDIPCPTCDRVVELSCELLGLLDREDLGVNEMRRLKALSSWLSVQLQLREERFRDAMTEQVFDALEDWTFAQPPNGSEDTEAETAVATR